VRTAPQAWAQYKPPEALLWRKAPIHASSTACLDRQLRADSPAAWFRFPVLQTLCKPNVFPTGLRPSRQL
jgi:hypothetical protein